MKYLICSVFLVFFIATNSFGQIYCPSDILASCFSSLTIEECGNATVVSGNYNSNQIKFEDDNQINACNEGQVFRKFYIDVDYSNSFTAGEPYCTQTITLTYDALPLSIQYPSELILNCVDEVPNTNPTWSSHPCDLVGYTFEDEIFEFEAGACLKIVRRFSVINWCEYEGSNGTGLYTGIQIIKIIDEEAPIIANCEDIVFDAVANCEAAITLTNIANDSGECPSGMLQWTLSVDLWADGTEDLFYGPNESQPFKLDKIQNGEEISITLPENVGIANHKLEWKVTDGCGNVRSCNARFDVKDNKPPTPYCKNFLSATLNGEEGWNLVVPAELFDNGATDNCSSQEELQISFSENVEDTERVIECGEIGFQFYRIYYTDQAGNQDFCEVFLFVLDNGSCAGKFEPQGRVVTRSGIPVEGATTYLMDDDGMVSESVTAEDGNYSFGDQSMMEAYYANVVKEDDPMEGVDILDYQMMLNGALGIDYMDYYTKIAADLNEDGKFDIDDLQMFKNVLTGELELSTEEAWKFIPFSQQSNDQNTQYNSDMSIMQYEHGFNFWAVKKGDLTSSEYNEITSDIETIELTLSISNDNVEITNNEKLKTGFFSIDLNVDVDLIEKSPEHGKHYANEDASRIINLENESISYDQNEFKVSINIQSIASAEEIKNELIGELSFINENQSSISSINWTVIDSRDSQENQIKTSMEELNVYPTIFINQITITDEGIESINLVSLNGQVIPFTFTKEIGKTVLKISENTPNGIYFLTVSTFEGDKVFQVAK